MSDALYDMSDEELETAFRDAKMNMNSGEEISTEDFEAVVDETATGDDLENLDNSQDSDLTSGEDAIDEAGEEASDSGKESPDGDADLDEEQTDEQAEDIAETKQPAQKLKYRANGKEYEFSQDEIMQQFPKIFGQAMDYTRKMQAIKPWRKTIDAIEQSKLNHNDVSLMIDVLKGDKAAIAAVLKRTGVDTLDLDSNDNSYVPKSYGRDEGTLAIKDVVDEISRDQEYSVTQKILSNEWDDNSWSEMSKDPQLIKLLHMDVKTGMYDKVQPIAEKMKLFEGGRRSDLDYYKSAAQEYFKELAEHESNAQQVEKSNKRAQETQQKAQKVAEVKRQEAQRKATEQASAKRKAAAPTKPGPSKPQGVTDYLEDSDESFNEWYKNLKDTM